jgi:hypothetical protein
VAADKVRVIELDRTVSGCEGTFRIQRGLGLFKYAQV